MTGTIQGTFGWSNAPLAQGMREAEQIATRGASSVSKKFESLFKRSPGRRAEQAVSNLVGDLASGNVAGGIANLAGRISGLGLGVGVALGAGVEIFEKFHAQIEATNAASEKLEARLREPMAINIKLPSADILEAIKERVAEAKDLQEKSLSWGSKIKGFFGALPVNFKGSSAVSNTNANADEIKQNEAIAQAKELALARADALAEEVKFRQMSLYGNEKQAQIEKFRLGLEQDIAKAQKEGSALKLPNAAVQKQIASLKRAEFISEEQVGRADSDKRAALKNRMQEALFSSTGASSDQVKAMALRMGIGEDTRQLKLGNNSQQQAELLADRAEKQSQLMSLFSTRAKADLLKTPEERQSEDAAEIASGLLSKRFSQAGRLTNWDKDLATLQGNWQAYLNAGTWDRGSTGGAEKVVGGEQLQSEINDGIADLNSKFEKMLEVWKNG